MHIAATTHEHASSAKVYSYEGEFEIGDGAVEWRAEVTREDDRRSFSGTIPLTSPGVAKLAEAAVRDAIVERIDTAFDSQ
jgi:hypothetical protein